MLIAWLGWQDVALWLAERPLPMPRLMQPFWLLALGLLPLLWALAAWRRRQVAQYAEAALRPWAEITLRQNPYPRRALWLLFGLFWLCAVLALADPRVPKSAASASTLRPPVLFLLDTTAAMQVADVAPDRLRRTQTLMAQLVEALPDRRLGLMVARDQAGMILPPTTDHALLATYLTDWSQLSRPLAPQQAADAFDWIAHLPMMRGGAVVWLTAADATDFSGTRGTALLAAAERLHQANIRLFALTVAGSGGVLLDHGQPIKDADDRPITSVPAPDRVAELARLTGGAAQVTRQIADDVRFVTQSVAQLPDLTPHAPAALDTRPLFALPLSLALIALASALFLVLRTRPERMPPVGLLLLAVGLLPGLAPPPAEAGSLWPTRSENTALIEAGQAALQQGDDARAQVEFTRARGFAARLGTGLAAFRRADYPYAIGQLQQALLLAHTPFEQTEARYNLGLALTLAGRYAAARDAFSAVAQASDVPEKLTAAANENLKIVEQILSTAAKNAANSPKFQGYQIATYGYAQDPTHSQFDKTIQKTEASVTGSNATAASVAPPSTPFVLNAATETSARAKLNLIENHPVPLLDSLLRQQPYHRPTLATPTPPSGAAP
ncbi:VWA domain-containing protein [Halothiobacillus sp. DCM-1]|uniref:VWA domain-containing protein n=1 Tax=Halothiobacillus sp. DCM-1 TaxID=3112558 RepID=UPI00324BE17B